MNLETQTPDRLNLLQQIWHSENETYNLTAAYDALPHQYGSATLYQAEGLIISLIARHPGITITELSNILHKTPSACSQMVRKLRNKGWVKQTRNKKNNRLYNLELTESGMELFHCHDAFNRECEDRTYSRLDSFTNEELVCFLKIRKAINLAYADDVERSRELLLCEAANDK